MRHLFIVFSFALLTSCSLLSPQPTPTPEGITWIDTVESPPGSVQIPHQKFKLDNGLTVILHQDNSDPLVNVDMTYHVGSAREVAGKSGFAHFFEHMMFQGSKHVGDQEHFRLITESGGNLNGATNRDTTNYYQTVPANELEKVLWLESDRMGFLLEAISQRKFEIQRDTVKNERAQQVDNRPYGLVSERISEALYPAGHPYSWPVIGYVEDLNRVDVNDLKQFFLRWYGPNNATLTIGGDIDVQQTLAWVNKYFGDIPAGPEVVDADPQPATLTETRYITLEDNIQQPMVIITYPAEHPKSDSRLPLDMLSAIVGQGRTSVMYQSLVKTEKLLSAGTYQECGELACNFRVYGLGKQGQSLADVYQLLLETLNEFEARGVHTEDLEPIKGMTEAELVFGLQSVEGKVSRLVHDEVFFKDTKNIKRWLDKVHQVKTDDIEQAYLQFVKNKPAVVLSVVPFGQADIAVAEQNFNHARTFNKIEEPTLPARYTPETFDRNKVPGQSHPVTVKVPKIYRSKLGNGIEVAGAVYDETPTVTMHLIMPAGRLMEPTDKIGLSNFTSSMLTEGSVRMSAEEMSDALDKLGSSVSISSGMRTTTVSLSTLKKNLAETMTLASQALFEPAFRQQDFDRIKAQMLESMMMRSQSATGLASQARKNIMYTDAYRTMPGEGSIETLSNITLDDVKQFYREHYVPNDTKVIVVGDISREKALTYLSPLAKWEEGKDVVAAKPQPKHYDQSRIWLVDKPDAPQSVIQMVRHAKRYDVTGEMYLAQLANFNLAGNFNSRLNQNLREDKGYTYGAGGSVMAGIDGGQIVFDAQVRADVTVDALNEMRNELAKASRQGFTDAEVDFMRLAVGQQDALNYETPGEKAGLIAGILQLDLPEDYRNQQKAIVETVQKETLNAVAKRWFNPNDYQIIVVGDAKSLAPELKTLGLPVEPLAIEAR